METEDYYNPETNDNYYSPNEDSSDKIFNKKRLVEILLGAVFIALLVLVVFLVISSGSNRTETTITNSYNTYNLYNAAPQPIYLITKPYVKDYDRIYYVYDDKDYDKRYYYDKYDRYYVKDDLRYYKKDNERLMAYDDYGRLKTYEGAFGNDVNRYEVYVRNTEYTGGHFKVTFHFEDYYGNVDKDTMVQYIPAREKKLFLFQDVSPERYKYRNWWYKVEPLSKVPLKYYY